MSQARRGRPPQISRDAVLEAAERLATRHGADALTMRRLAVELGVSPMALYRHVPDKDALLVALLDRQVAVLHRPRLPRDPRARLAVIFRWLYDGLDDRPWVVDLLTRGDLIAPSVVWAMEDILAAFTRLGLTAHQAVDAYLTAWRFTVGTLVIRHASRRTLAKLEHEPVQMRVVRTADAGATPLLAETGPYWAQARAEYDYDAGLRAVLNGLLTPGKPSG
ncbi:MAG TPA: helix-turn-helix domain-containing protein [Jatrophihabitantaceae bacterium]|jgi:AcrR family transcriptional regulator